VILVYGLAIKLNIINIHNIKVYYLKDLFNGFIFVKNRFAKIEFHVEKVSGRPKNNIRYFCKKRFVEVETDVIKK